MLRKLSDHHLFQTTIKLFQEKLYIYMLGNISVDIYNQYMLTILITPLIVIKAIDKLPDKSNVQLKQIKQLMKSVKD